MKSIISTLLILIFLGIGMTSSNAQTLDSFNLEDYKWKNRVLIVFSPNTYNPDYREQVKTVRSSTKGIQDRDLQIFYALDQSSAMAKGKILPDDATNALRNTFDIPSSDFTTILVGKDGTEKLRTDGSLSSSKLFDTIDAMPMRKLEMKNDDGS
jgi:hypothetical protein